jgi:hypothetical protein
VKNIWICFLSLLLLSACASITQKRAVEWPDTIDYIEASGDLTMAWRKIDFAGSVALQMNYPDLFVLEIYGMFGQTIAYVKKESGTFLLVAGDEKTSDRGAFEEKYGLRLENFMDDLAMKGEKKQVNGLTVIERSNYRVFYSEDRRGRMKMTWQGPDGRMQLLFTQVSFTKEKTDVKNSGGKV